MARLSKYLCLCIVIILLSALSSVNLSEAQTSPDLTPPKFELQYVDSSYNDSNSYRQNITIFIKIENHLPTIPIYRDEPYIGLYYNISSKRSNELSWSYFPTYTALNNWTFIHTFSVVNYTVIPLAVKGNNVTSYWSNLQWFQEAPPGVTLEFRVQAYLAYDYQIPNPAPFSPAPGYNYYIDIQKIVEKGDWSPVQSITIPGPTASPLPPQTALMSVTLLFVVLSIILAVMAITVILILRKLKTIKN